MKILKAEEDIGRRLIAFLTVILFFALLWHITRPIIIIESNGKILFSTAAEVGTKFSTHFIHSVQKTPVEEFFVVNETCDGFILKSTRYRSFGVGLPFLESDGEFHRAGDDFIMDNLNRPIKNLDLRPGIGTNLTLNINDESLPLYEMVPLGSLVSISINRRIELYLK